jgi:hypothetical protein
MTKEQVENLQEAKAGVEKVTEGAEGRERSTIQFPYNDLDDAADLARVIYNNASGHCTLDQLAGYVKQPITSGTFRLRVSNASTFGLTENERGGVRLTDLGRRIADTAQEAAARVDAFMNVPLYQRIYDNYKGFTLPGPAALEKFMRDVGVSSKQTGKARHAFARSAKQAGFFAHGDDRLVRPASLGPGTKPVEDPKAGAGQQVQQEIDRGGGGGGDGTDDLGLDPLLIALLKKVPSPDKGWPGPARIRWFRTFAMNVSQIYDADGEPVEMKIDLEKATN